MSLLLSCYQGLTWILEPFSGALLKQRLKQDKERTSRIEERKGLTNISRPEGKLIWMHGASVGETGMLLKIFETLKQSYPNLNALITSQTLTSADMIASRNVEGVIHQMAPMDGPRAVSAFLNHWTPDLAILAEGEIWPNMISKTGTRRIPLFLINARMTSKSIAGWKKRRIAAQKLFNTFSFIGAADSQTRDGLEDILKRKLDTEGNIKLAIDPPACKADELQAWKTSLKTRPVLLAASTHEAEEEFAIDAFELLKQNDSIQQLNPLLIIVPRHPARAEKVAYLLKSRELSVKRRTLDVSVGCESEVLLADTIGEMGLWFRLCNAVYMGGATAQNIGGHNPIEPLKLHKPVFSGPHAFNFEDLVAKLSSCDAFTIGNTSTQLATFWQAHTPSPDTDSKDIDWSCIEDIFSVVEDPMKKTIQAVQVKLKD